jgi:hypothetical protein
MALLIGALLALTVGIFATILGLDRERSFYPTVAIVIAFLYALFAVIGGSHPALLTESLVGGLFLAAASIGFRASLWWVVAALAAHGIFDSFHPHVISNPGVPIWWPPFCLSYDVTAAAYLTWLIRSGRVRDRPEITR